MPDTANLAKFLYPLTSRALEENELLPQLQAKKKTEIWQQQMLNESLEL